MLSYLEIALINAVMVVPLAILTEIAGRTFRRPALTHLLWVLILVKLVTPPLWQIPLIDRDWAMSVGRQFVPPVLIDVNTMELRQRLAGITDDSVNELKSQPSPPPRVRPRTLANRDRRVAVKKETLQSVLMKSIRSENIRLLAMAGLLNVWALGALVWFVVQGSRCVRFRLALHQGYAAGADLQRQADKLARRMGLAYSPTVWLMPGVMSPMLWGSGQSLLLIFPELLLDRLDEDATGTLLTHELSHYRRRDHWVRVLALLTTGFFWWHPVVWWARREIEAAEEECCDAMVVTIAPTAPKRYAEAILDVVDFLAELDLRMPALATGLGQVPFLRQRLTWIMQGPRRQDLGYCGWALCLLLACLLPLQPSWVAARTSLPPNELFPAVTSAVPANAAPQSTQVEVAVADVDQAEGGSDYPDSTQKTQPNPSRWSGSEIRAQSANGRFVVVGNKQYQSLLDLETGHEFDLMDFTIQAMAFAQSVPEFVSISADGILRLWNAETCEVIRAWKLPGGAAKSVDFSADGGLIATGGRDGIVRIWNRSLAEPMHELPRELAPVNCVRFSQYGDHMAVATGDWMSPQNGRIALIDMIHWSEVISMNWNSPAAAVAFHGDGKTLISGDWQGRVARWSLESGELLGLSSGHKDLMAAAEFSSNSSPLMEIDIPDLHVDASWGEPEPTESPLWIFSGWGLNPAGNINSSSSRGAALKR